MPGVPEGTNGNLTGIAQDAPKPVGKCSWFNEFTEEFAMRNISSLNDCSALNGFSQNPTTQYISSYRTRLYELPIDSNHIKTRIIYQTNTAVNAQTCKLPRIFHINYTATLRPFGQLVSNRCEMSALNASVPLFITV